VVFSKVAARKLQLLEVLQMCSDKKAPLIIENKEPLLGLDVGEIRVGSALYLKSDLAPRPHATFNRAKGEAEKELISLLERHSIRYVVAGYPLSESGAATPQCEKIASFLRRLKKRSNCEIFLVDEYLTSQEAIELTGGQLGKSLKSQIASRKKGIIDKVSASLILQRFLIEQRNGQEVWRFGLDSPQP
jgi:putative Holliday junction resolvase